MISLTNYNFQWARSELVIIYPDRFPKISVDLRKFPQKSEQLGATSASSGHQKTRGGKMPLAASRIWYPRTAGFSRENQLENHGNYGKPQPRLKWKFKAGKIIYKWENHLQMEV